MDKFTERYFVSHDTNLWDEKNPLAMCATSSLNQN